MGMVEVEPHKADFRIVLAVKPGGDERVPEAVNGGLVVLELELAMERGKEPVPFRDELGDRSGRANTQSLNEIHVAG